MWATAKFLVPLRDAVAAKKEAGTLAPMRPEIRDFKNWVTRNSVYRRWVTSMIEEANAVVGRLSEESREVCGIRWCVIPRRRGMSTTRGTHFFIREFVPGARPFKGDPAVNINIDCETLPRQYENNVVLETGFWIKNVSHRNDSNPTPLGSVIAAATAGGPEG